MARGAARSRGNAAESRRSAAVAPEPEQRGRRMGARALRAWRRVHTWTSLVCAAFLLMLCLTGLPLIFHDEIDALFEDGAPIQAVPDAPRISLDQALQIALEAAPGEIGLFMSFDIDRPVVNVTTGPRPRATADEMTFLSVDLGAGQPIGSFFEDEGFMHVMLKLHTDMFLGPWGETFLGFMGFLFVLALVSGAVIYGPYMSKLRFGALRRSRGSRATWLDAHNLLGAVTLVWAAVVGLTGVINTLSTPLVDLWRADQLAELAAGYDDLPVPPRAQLASLDAAVRTAVAAAPEMEPQFVAFPGVRFSSNHHYAVWLRGKTPATERILKPALIDGVTGELTAMRSMPWYMLALRLSQPLHFGDYGGLPMKVLWAALDVLTIVILGSGLYLWLARRPRA